MNQLIPWYDRPERVKGIPMSRIEGWESEEWRKQMTNCERCRMWFLYVEELLIEYERLKRSKPFNAEGRYDL